jgi:hypothetical protein
MRTVANVHVHFIIAVPLLFRQAQYVSYQGYPEHEQEPSIAAAD